MATWTSFLYMVGTENFIVDSFDAFLILADHVAAQDKDPRGMLSSKVRNRTLRKILNGVRVGDGSVPMFTLDMGTAYSLFFGFGRQPQVFKDWALKTGVIHEIFRGRLDWLFGCATEAKLIAAVLEVAMENGEYNPNRSATALYKGVSPNIGNV